MALYSCRLYASEARATARGDLSRISPGPALCVRHGASSYQPSRSACLLAARSAYFSWRLAEAWWKSSVPSLSVPDAASFSYSSAWAAAAISSSTLSADIAAQGLRELCAPNDVGLAAAEELDEAAGPAELDAAAWLGLIESCI